MSDWEVTSREAEVAPGEQTSLSDTGHSAEPHEPPDLETVLHLMWDRLEKLEAEKRRLKRTATIVLAGLTLVTGVFAVNWIARTKSTEPYGPMLLRDANGSVRARLEADPVTGATILQLLAPDGRPQAKLAADDSGSGLTFYDREGDPRLRMGVVSESPTLDLIDKAGAKQTRHDLSSGQTTSRHLASDEPRERARESRRRRPAAGTPSEVSPRPRSATCWPGTLGCGYSSRVDDATGGPG